ncbi:hypothetical protein EVAR_18930_1 [Eumeta japonica]|uniref:Uncharacterized protein n=1 Tax=Eumeta variegata TaxID=151549 RepID=A0A4C1V3C2_EUMVA|nr:hypothetical protein EVAR_18930_1 [Eumeta japonica]
MHHKERSIFSRKIVTAGERRRRFLSGIPFNTENGPIAGASAPGDTSAGSGGRRRPRQPAGAAGFRGRGEPAPAASGARCTHRCRRPKKNIRRDEKFRESPIHFQSSVPRAPRRARDVRAATVPAPAHPPPPPPRAARVAFSFQ